MNTTQEILAQQEDDVLWNSWKQHPWTRVFLTKLAKDREDLLVQIENLAGDEKRQGLLLKQTQTIRKVIEYANNRK